MSDTLIIPGAATTKQEQEYLRTLASQTTRRFGPDCAIVNIGVGLGGSCMCLRAGAPEATLVGIDIDPGVARGDWTSIRADSRRFALPPPVHLLFVDGAHDYAAVKSDIRRWTPSVVTGGTVAFHDYDNGLPFTAGVRPAVDELMDGDAWSVVGRVDSIKAFQKK